MTFVIYDESNRSLFDESSQKQLNELHQKFGNVEFKKLEKDGYCIRIHVDQTDGPLPFAAIGKTQQEAVSRMVALTKML